MTQGGIPASFTRPVCHGRDNSVPPTGGILLQNGVDGRTIHDELSDTSQPPMGDVTFLRGRGGGWFLK
jgi:hypothetical protein